MTPPAGWYEDPDGVMRWWDGAQWTEYTQPPPAAPQQPGMPPAGQYGQPGGQYAGQPGQPGQPGPTHAAYPMQPTQQQPGQPPGQPPFQQQWGTAYPGGPGGKPPRKMNPALLFGIGGAALLVIVAAIVIVLVTRDGSSDSADDPLTPSASASSSSSASVSPSPSESPTEPSPTQSSGPHKKGWPPELPTNAPHDYPHHDDVVGAPKNASVGDFCHAQKLILDLPDGDTDAYYAWFWYRIQIGTPADMSADAREGWVEDVSVDDGLKKKKFDAFEDYEFNRCY